MVTLPEFVESPSLVTATQHNRVSRNNATLAVPAVEQGDLVPKGGGTYVEALAMLGEGGAGATSWKAVTLVTQYYTKCNVAAALECDPRTR
ncbi:hypothetical protein CUR178_04975 [Leishmania enriettii]|uniref:Uncharacterized protein n=1 Tax=Leishmania enriettii TaxID=5663 RepID=A0A836H636_LEIEN|nr:hypothetical protein CUR178_04975 [Leishmania enriettii]